MRARSFLLDALCLMRPGQERTLRAIGLVLAVGANGCGYAIERNWESLSRLENGQLNELAVFADKTADTTLYAVRPSAPSTWTKFYFEGTWFEENDFFHFSFACKNGPCSDADFELKCQLVDENKGETFKLDCNANGQWKDYPFNWQEVL